MHDRPKIAPKFPKPLGLWPVRGYTDAPAGATPAQDARMQTLAALEHRSALPLGRPVPSICHRPRHAAAPTSSGVQGLAVRGHGLIATDSAPGAGRHGARAVAPSSLACLGWRLMDLGAQLFLYGAFCVLWVEDRAVRASERLRGMN